MTKTFLLVLLACCAIISFNSCGSKKNLAKGRTKIETPCGDKWTDKTFFRGQGSGKSQDLNTARKKARLTAESELAAGITTTIKSVTQSYTESNEIDRVENLGKTFEDMTTRVVNQEMSNVRVCCNETYEEADGSYTVYMALEANKEEVYNKLEKNFNEAKELQTKFNREKFREVYNKEMEEFAKKQGY